MNKNQIIVLFLISLFLLFYFHFFSPKPLQNNNHLENEQTSIKYEKLFYTDELVNKNENTNYSIFSNFLKGNEEEIIIENELILIKFNSKGGLIKEVLLKKYKDYNYFPLVLFDSKSNEMFLKFTSNGININTSDLFFKIDIVNGIANKREVAKVIFTLNIDKNSYIKQIFLLPVNSYIMGYQLEFFGMDSYLDNDSISFFWNDLIKRLEKNINESRTKTTINYYSINNGFEYLNENSSVKEEKILKDCIQWISIKQKFFTSGIISENYFKKCCLSTLPIYQDKESLKLSMINLSFSFNSFKKKNKNFIFYFGPNIYEELYKLNDSFIFNIFLGWPIINLINKIIIIPIFKFLCFYFDNYGFIIILLVLIIKLILFPLSYKSYISTVKMRLLKPELDLIKLNNAGNAQKIQVDQMKLYKDVGINPLGGCIPVLLQMPILLAMFNFFPNTIDFRQKSFLWSDDLSTFDSIYNLSFTIPLYGNHVSMFTLLMSFSTILYSWSNNQMNLTKGPIKLFSYIMPLSFIFILNSFPSGLTFYYFISNLFTFIQYFFIKYFINEDKIKNEFKKNKKQKIQKSKFQFYLDNIIKSN